MFQWLIPDQMVHQVEDISLEILVSQDIKLCIVDIDNTLSPHRQFEVNSSKIAWLQACKDYGLEVVLLSNNRPQRVHKILKELNLPGYAQAAKPFSVYYKEIEKKYNISAKQIVVIGDQILTDILAGKWRGYQTIYVKPILSRDIIFSALSRYFERVLFKHWQKKGWIDFI